MDWGTSGFQNKSMRLLFQGKAIKWLFMSCFVSEYSDLNIDALLIFICQIMITSMTRVLDGLVFLFAKKNYCFT